MHDSNIYEVCRASAFFESVTAGPFRYLVYRAMWSAMLSQYVDLTKLGEESGDL
jgi:hypothetical protein